MLRAEKPLTMVSACSIQRPTRSGGAEALRRVQDLYMAHVALNVVRCTESVMVEDDTRKSVNPERGESRCLVAVIAVVAELAAL